VCTVRNYSCLGVINLFILVRNFFLCRQYSHNNDYFSKQISQVSLGKEAVFFVKKKNVDKYQV
jgi:hypothetical protein